LAIIVRLAAAGRSEDLALGEDGNLVPHGLRGCRVPRPVERAVFAVDHSTVTDTVDHAHGGAHFPQALVGLSLVLVSVQLQYVAPEASFQTITG